MKKLVLFKIVMIYLLMNACNKDVPQPQIQNNTNTNTNNNSNNTPGIIAGTFIGQYWWTVNDSDDWHYGNGNQNLTVNFSKNVLSITFLTRTGKDSVISVDSPFVTYTYWLYNFTQESDSPTSEVKEQITINGNSSIDFSSNGIDFTCGAEFFIRPHNIMEFSGGRQ